jgi:hypothetical protein
VQRFWDLSDLGRLGVLFVAGFGSAQVARRVLVELELGAAVVATVIAMAVMIGLYAQQRYHGMELAMLIPCGVAAAGGLAGASTAAGRKREVAQFWGLLGGGFASVGAMLVVAGAIALFTDRDYVVLAMFVGGAVGAFVFVLSTPVPASWCAFGVALVFATAIPAQGLAAQVGSILGGFLLGWLVGAIGAGIGGRIRDRRTPRPDLPAAQVR